MSASSLDIIQYKIEELYPDRTFYPWYLYSQSKTNDEKVVSLLLDPLERGYIQWLDIIFLVTHEQAEALSLLMYSYKKSYSEQTKDIIISGNKIALTVRLYDIFYNLHRNLTTPLSFYELLELLRSINFISLSQKNNQQSR